MLTTRTVNIHYKLRQLMFMKSLRVTQRCIKIIPGAFVLNRSQVTKLCFEKCTFELV